MTPVMKPLTVDQLREVLGVAIALSEKEVWRLQDLLRVGVLSLLICCTLAGCIGEGRALTAQDECVRAGGVWLYTGCEHSAGGGAGGGGGM